MADVIEAAAVNNNNESVAINDTRTNGDKIFIFIYLFNQKKKKSV